MFVPARLAPHKQDSQVSSALHRYAMLALATQDDRGFVFRPSNSKAATQYTVDTLEHFRAEFGDAAELFFVMGADSWTEITTWRDWEKVLSLVNHIVVTRPGYEFAADHLGQR